MRAGAALVLVAGLAACGSTGSGKGVAQRPPTARPGRASAERGRQDPRVGQGAVRALHAQARRRHAGPDEGRCILTAGGGPPGQVDLRKIDAAGRRAGSSRPTAASWPRPRLTPWRPAQAGQVHAGQRCRRTSRTRRERPAGRSTKSCGIDPRPRRFKAAQAKCAQYLPAGGQHNGWAAGSARDGRASGAGDGRASVVAAVGVRDCAVGALRVRPGRPEQQRQDRGQPCRRRPPR